MPLADGGFPEAAVGADERVRLAELLRASASACDELSGALRAATVEVERDGRPSDDTVAVVRRFMDRIDELRGEIPR